MKLYQRIALGAEAGALAGAGVILLFLFQDTLRLEPLATPNALALGLVGPEGVPLDTELVGRAVGVTVLGVRLLAYTFLHFLVFALVGVASVFLIPGGSWLRSLASGGVVGVTLCTAVFYGSRWIGDAPVHLDAVGPASVLVANAVAGVILGAGLYLGRSEAGAERREAVG